MIKYLLSKHEVMSSNPSPPKKLNLQVCKYISISRKILKNYEEEFAVSY
jgi:hypothetical protein